MTRPAPSETSSPSSSPPTDSPLTGAQQIVDTLHEPLLVLDRDLRVRQVNPAFYRAFGATEEDTIGRPLFELGGGHFDHPALRDPLSALLETREPFEGVELESTFEAQEKVFQIFNQLDPHGAGQEGSGMGLALCKKIAERHDGDIWVESEPGEGSAFHVTLHLSPPNAS